MVEAFESKASTIGSEQAQFNGLQSEIYMSKSEDWSGLTATGASSRSASEQLPQAQIRRGNDGEMLDITFASPYQSNNDDPLAAGMDAGVQEKAALKPREVPQGSGTAGEKPAEVPHLNDADARRLIQFREPDFHQKADAIKAGILAGKDVSETINKLGRDERTAVMTQVKIDLANTPGTKLMVVTGEDGSRHLMYTTKDGGKIHISEDSYGQPKDIQVSGNWRTLGRAKDIYDRPGENKDTGGGGGSAFNPIEYLQSTTRTEGANGPLTKLRRGDELNEEEWKQLEETARRSGGKLIIYKRSER